MTEYTLHDALATLGCEDVSFLKSKGNDTLKVTTIHAHDKKDTNGYRLVTYRKGVCDNTVEEKVRTVGLLRSVIFNGDNNLVCIAPPKAMAYAEFKSKYPTLKNMITEEFIDGTMVNMFWDPESGEQRVGAGSDMAILGGGWRIATRKNIGAHNHFYRYSNTEVQRNFGVLFMETFLSANVDMGALDKTCCYSFVLRHPENRVVTYVSMPVLFLVNVFQLRTEPDAKHTATVLAPSDYASRFEGSSIKFPRAITNLETYDQLEQKMDDHAPDGTLVKGYILKCPITNLRTKIVSDEYTFVNDLRGNFSDMRFLFLTLHKERKMQDYLHYYPEQHGRFDEYMHLLQDYTHCLHSLYRDCYLGKTKPLGEYPVNYRTHMYKVHGIYKGFPIDEETCRRRSVLFRDVVYYVNALDTPLLFDSMFVAHR